MGRSRGKKKTPRRPTPSVSQLDKSTRQETASDVTPDEEKAEVTEQTEKKIAKQRVDVYARLNYPLIAATLNGQLAEDSDEEDSLQISFWPRFIFVSNLCLVCMERSSVVCDSCRMVSYCSTKHRKQNLDKHRELCGVLTEICSRENGLSLAKNLSADQYRLFRLKLIEIVERHLNRSLQLWEREIILYPRVCRSCHDSSDKLKCCQSCYVDFFCDDHENDHAEWCRDFQVLRTTLTMQFKHGYASPEIPNIVRKTPLELPDNFDALMAYIYDGSAYYRKMDSHTYSTLSQLSTIPVTTLYSVQAGCSEWRSANELVIHVVGAEFQFEGSNLHVWEKLFLHFLPSVKKLTLIFVGPELRLPDVPMDLLAKVRLCSACKSAGRKVEVCFQAGKFYHDYGRSGQFVKPNLICLFNPGLYRQTAFDGKDTWPDTIREFCKTNVPVCVTSYTLREIPCEMERIKSICDVDVLLEPRRNPFASVKPDRNFVSDDTVPLIYKNYYVAVVKGKS